MRIVKESVIPWFPPFVPHPQAANTRIAAICKSISELVLVSVEKKKIYQQSEFQEVQAAHHEQVTRNLCGEPVWGTCVGNLCGMNTFAGWPHAGWTLYTLPVFLAPTIPCDV